MSTAEALCKQVINTLGSQFEFLALGMPSVYEIDGTILIDLHEKGTTLITNIRERKFKTGMLLRCTNNSLDCCIYQLMPIPIQSKPSLMQNISAINSKIMPDLAIGLDDRNRLHTIAGIWISTTLPSVDEIQGLIRRAQDPWFEYGDDLPEELSSDERRSDEQLNQLSYPYPTIYNAALQGDSEARYWLIQYLQSSSSALSGYQDNLEAAARTGSVSATSIYTELYGPLPEPIPEPIPDPIPDPVPVPRKFKISTLICLGLVIVAVYYFLSGRIGSAIFCLFYAGLFKFLAFLKDLFIS